MTQPNSSPDSFVQFVATLADKLNLTSEQIVDVLWMTIKRQEFEENRKTVVKKLIENTQQVNIPTDRHQNTSIKNINTKGTSIGKAYLPKKAPVYVVGNSPQEQGLLLRIPDAPSLREPIHLAQSLRPLMRRVTTGHMTVLDEVATVQRFAEERICIPILKPEPQPWLDLALVIDESQSMLIWQHTIRDLQRLLSNYGIFRDMRIWCIKPDPAGEKLQMFSRMGSNHRLVDPKEIIDPTGRRLILVVSDCVSNIWRQGMIFPILQEWTQKQPLAIMQMLPEWMWKRTALGLGTSVGFSSSIIGVANRNLLVNKKFSSEQKTKIPILTLEPDRVAQWSQMLVGKADAAISGYTLPVQLNIEFHPQLRSQKQAINSLDASQRVQRFRMTASPLSRKLAGLLAAAPIINLPIVRLIQQTLLPSSRSVQVAEVFLGGLLKPKSVIATDTNPDTVEYEFIEPESRNILLEDSPISDSTDVLNAVSRYVAEEMGKSLDDFMALLKAPSTANGENIRPFAEVAARILKKMGGEYARFAEELETSDKVNEVPQNSKNQGKSDFNRQLQNVRVGGDITANIDQSVGKTVNYQAPKENQLIPSNVRQGSPNFVGRETELEQIHAKLQNGQGVIVCAVEGMGGVGKTELALQYAQHYKDEYVAQYFLQLRGIGLAQAVVTLANPYLALPESMQSASLEEQAAWYWLNWKPEQGRLLVILDDVSNAESIPDAAMPNDERVRVLVTTRERDLDLGFVSLSLDILSRQKALELLTKIVGAAKVDRELAKVEQVCEILGYLPLAIELVGEYLVKNRHLTFANLQKNLRLADKVLSQEHKHKFYAYRGVEAAILLSWQDLSAASQRVAIWLGLFAPVGLEWKLVADMAEIAEITESELDEARGELDRLHLIQPVGEDCNFYKIHTLVREFFRDRLAQATENRLFREAFVRSLVDVAKQIPQSPTRDLIATVAPAIPQLDMLSREMLGDIPNLEEDLGWAFTGIARFYEGQGLYALAEDPYQRCLKATQELLGDHHPDVATSLNNLAALYKLQGRYAEAEPLYKQALLLWQELLGDRHPNVATSLNNLAALYKSQGRYEEAEPLYKQALLLWQELLGDRHPDVAASLNNIADLYRLQGRYAEAEPLLKQALSLRHELLGDRHPDVANSLNNLAVLYESQGRYAEAEPLYKQALLLRHELLGDRHPDVANSLNNLAVLYESQGRYAEAEPLYKQALALSQELLGDSHPDVASSLNNLAALYRVQGRYEEAEPLYIHALALRQELLGDHHPDVATSLNNLALLYYSQERYEEAESLYKRALLLWQELLGDHHPDVATSLNNLALLYYSQKRYEEAEPLYQQALAMRQELLGDHHPDVASNLNNLAALRYTQNRYDEAEVLLLQALEICESVLGSNHPNTLNVKESIAYLTSVQDKK